MEALMTWLTVGGCPRSGTTALGAILNAHPEIALLHEYDQAHFFTTVRELFREEGRLGTYHDANNFEQIPRRTRHEIPIIRAIFREVTGKGVSVVGTKFPGAHLWPRPSLPAAIAWKQIYITREPYAVITSYTKKMQRESYPGGTAHILDTAIAHWISAWNYAVEHRNADRFMHLIYEKLGDHSTVAAAVAQLLGVSPTLDFTSFRAENKSISEYERQLAEAGFQDHLGRMDFANKINDWSLFSEAGDKLGFPLAAGEAIDLTNTPTANGWKYPITGFYQAENEGRWIRGADAEILVIPQFSAHMGLLSLDIPWTFEPGGVPPAISVEVDGVNQFDSTISLGNENGSLKRIAFGMRNLDLRAGVTSSIRIRVHNPRNPKQLGISQDDRNLSAMIHSLRIDPI